MSLAFSVSPRNMCSNAAGAGHSDPVAAVKAWRRCSEATAQTKRSPEAGDLDKGATAPRTESDLYADRPCAEKAVHARWVFFCAM
jgi:hypothetical protein